MKIEIADRVATVTISRLILTAETITAGNALRIGLIPKVTEAEMLMQEVLKLAEKNVVGMRADKQFFGIGVKMTTMRKKVYMIAG